MCRGATGVQSTKVTGPACGPSRNHWQSCARWTGHRPDGSPAGVRLRGCQNLSRQKWFGARTHSCWSFAQLCSPAATPGFRAEEDRRPRKPRGGRCFVADASRGAVWDISETLPRTAGGRPLSEAEGECPWVSAAPRGALLACDGKRSAAVTFFPRVSSSGIARSG